MNTFLIYRFLVGLDKKKLLNIFCLNYASVYLMLNTVCETKLKSVDYKSIALPAELQGHKCFVVLFKRLSSYFFLLIYIMKSNRGTV